MSVELENLVVRLTSDVKGVVEGYEQIRKQNIGLQHEVQQLENQMVKSGGEITGVFHAIGSAAGAIGLGALLNKAKDEFTAAETNAFKLSSTIKANKEDVAGLSKEYDRFASRIQETSAVSKEQVISVLHLAERYKMTGAAAEDAALKAIQLSKATEMAPEHALRLVKAFKEGDQHAIMAASHSVKELQMLRTVTEKQEEYQRLIAQGQEMMSGELGTTAGKAQQLTNNFKELMVEAGSVVVKMLEPLNELKKDAMELWSSMSQGTKDFIVTAAGVVVAILAIKAAIMVAGLVFNTMFGGVGILIGLVVTGAAAFAAWAASVGGLGKVWEMVKEKAIQFWEFIKPIRDALVDLWDAVTETVEKMWANLKEMASRAWSAIAGDTQINWRLIVERVREGIKTIEYIIRHLKETFDILWLGIKIGAHSAFNDLKFLFTDQLPAVVMQVYDLLLDHAMRVKDAHTMIMRGQLTDATRKIVEESKRSLEKLGDIKIPTRSLDAWERENSAKLSGMWAKWKAGLVEALTAKKSDEIFKEDKKGLDGVKDSAEAARREIQKLQSVLAGTAEARGLIAGFLSGGGGVPGKLAGGAGEGAVARFFNFPENQPNDGKFPPVRVPLPADSGAASRFFGFPTQEEKTPSWFQQGFERLIPGISGLIDALKDNTKATEKTTGTPNANFNEN